MAVKSYNFQQVAVSFGGQLINGFAEGDAVDIEYDSEEYTLMVGADGEGARSKRNNFSAKVTLKLMKTSDSNDILNAFLQADRASGAGTEPLLIKDNSGRELHAAETAWIEHAPKGTFGNESGEREWVLRTDHLISTFGGN